jgi:hypothetical protein
MDLDRFRIRYENLFKIAVSHTAKSPQIQQLIPTIEDHCQLSLLLAAAAAAAALQQPQPEDSTASQVVSCLKAPNQPVVSPLDS